jgi:hypothetical protein
MVNHEINPAAAYEAHRRGLQIAQDSGNRFAEIYHAGNLARLAAAFAEPVEALDYITLSIRNFYDSGSISMLPSALGVLATFLDRHGRFEPAAVISRFAATPFTRTTYPEFDLTIAHLREVLDADTLDSLAAAGEAMTFAAITSYAFDEIDRARADLQAELQKDESP